MSLNILIVDDSATMRRMVGRTLAMSGLPLGQVHEAGNGAEGLAALERGGIHVVFADLNMPLMGGLEMIDRIRAQPQHARLPIIVISTETNPARIAEIEKKGVHFVHKPFTPEAVRDVVQGLLGGAAHVAF